MEMNNCKHTHIKIISPYGGEICWCINCDKQVIYTEVIVNAHLILYSNLHIYYRDGDSRFGEKIAIYG